MGDDVMSPADSAKETPSSSNSPMSSPTSVTKYSIAELLSPTKSEKKSNIPCLSCSECFSTVAELSHHLSTEHRPLLQTNKHQPSVTESIPLLRRPQPYIPLLSGSFQH